MLFLNRELAAQADIVHENLGGIFPVFSRWRKRRHGIIELVAQFSHAMLGAFNLASFLHHGAIGLELCEGLFQKAERFLETKHSQQIDRHIVARCKSGNERIRTGRSKASYLTRIHGGGPLHDCIAQRIDATASCAARQLRVLACGEIDVRLTIELDELF